MISSEVAALGRGGELAAEQRQARTEQFRRDLKQVKDTAAELERGLAGRDDFLKLSAPKRLGEDVRQRFETPIPKKPAGKRGPQAPFVGFEAPDEKLDVYEQMKRQILGLRKPFKPAAAIQKTKEPAEGEAAAEGAAVEEGEEFSPLDELSSVELSSRAKTVMGSYESFASFSEDKFNRYLRAAEQYLKQGKYYRAADAYTLASIYKSDDPLAYAGKSHALFAAGEYMSSALFLSRALAIFPEYARFKIDIEAMVGDRDKLETRVADVEEWLKRSGAAELQFLLGYVYYQMGRPERAKEAIDGAYEKMPEAPAVITLKEAIYEYINSKPRP
jgi:tetratricopeptide (TPR) repeat protein